MATTVKRDEKPVFVPVVITIDSEEDLLKFLNGTFAASHGIQCTLEGAESYMRQLNKNVHDVVYKNGSAY